MFRYIKQLWQGREPHGNSAETSIRSGLLQASASLPSRETRRGGGEGDARKLRPAVHPTRRTAPQMPVPRDTAAEEVLQSEIRPDASPEDKDLSTPERIVEHAVTLPGVDGCLVTFNDGLLVAAAVPERFDAELLGGMLPQAFTRFGKHLELGSLGKIRELTMRVDAVDWWICSVNGVLLVAFSKENQILPSKALRNLVVNLKACHGKAVITEGREA